MVDELERIDVRNIQGVFFTDIEKENMLNHLKLLMEKKLLKIPGDDKQLIAQINEQQYEYLNPKQPKHVSTSSFATHPADTTTNSTA